MNNNTICLVDSDNIDKLLLHHKQTYRPEGVLMTSIPDNINLYFIPKSRASEVSLVAGGDGISYEALVAMHAVFEIHERNNGIEYTFSYDKNGSRHSIRTIIPVSEYENSIGEFYTLRNNSIL